jgi:hypothetical protein
MPTTNWIFSLEAANLQAGSPSPTFLLEEEDFANPIVI